MCVCKFNPPLDKLQNNKHKIQYHWSARTPQHQSSDFIFSSRYMVQIYIYITIRLHSSPHVMKPFESCNNDAKGSTQIKSIFMTKIWIPSVCTQRHLRIQYYMKPLNQHRPLLESCQALHGFATTTKKTQDFNVYKKKKKISFSLPNAIVAIQPHWESPLVLDACCWYSIWLSLLEFTISVNVLVEKAARLDVIMAKDPAMGLLPMEVSNTYLLPMNW